MLEGKKVGVVVPACNEEDRIWQVLETMPSFVDWIIVVDDDSHDRTSSKVQAYKEKDPKVHLVRHSKNQGVGAAISTGYRQALEEGLDVVAVMAGDGLGESFPVTATSATPLSRF